MVALGTLTAAYDSNYFEVEHPRMVVITDPRYLIKQWVSVTKLTFAWWMEHRTVPGAS